MKNTSIKVVDTSTLVHDPSCLNYLMQKGVTACIPWKVLEELDGLKGRPDIGFDAREAIRNIEELRQGHHPNLMIAQRITWDESPFLDPKTNDHHILSTAVALKEKFKKVAIVSKDSMMRIKARELNVEAEDYYRNQAERNNEEVLPRIVVPPDIINTQNFTFAYDEKAHGDIPLNSGVVCVSTWTGDMKRPDERDSEGEHFVAVRHNGYFQIVNKNIQAFGIRPYSGPEVNSPVVNWPQHIALYLLTNPAISLIFLEGGAGTGKTLLALAAAMAVRSRYRQILVSRPMVHLEDMDNMGFLPGDIREKMGPWLRPIWQNLSVLKEIDPKNKELIEKMIAEKKIEIEPLDYIRGTTFWKCLLIIDEAQNLTPHQIKTIITRAGEGSKIIFTGDLDQIDRRRRLDKISSGLAYASGRLQGQEIVASIKFKTSVRSELAKIGVELL
ncbi:PhoH family protein [Desulfatiferula olefinivorans]